MRSYLTFGSDDKINWEQLKTVQASGATQALNQARAQEAHNHYAVVPERNWTSATPSVVDRAPVVKWTEITPNQMRIDDAPADKEPAKEERNVL
jgi:hypothetical protein